MGLVQHLDGGGAPGNALHEVDAIHYGARRPIPFGDYQNVAGAESINGALELGAVLHRLTGDLLTEDRIAA